MSSEVIWIDDDEWTSYSAFISCRILDAWKYHWSASNGNRCGGYKVTKLSTRIDSVNAALMTLSIKQLRVGLG